MVGAGNSPNKDSSAVYLPRSRQAWLQIYSWMGGYGAGCDSGYDLSTFMQHKENCKYSDSDQDLLKISYLNRSDINTFHSAV
jgi:hypothetical protein